MSLNQERLTGSENGASTIKTLISNFDERAYDGLPPLALAVTRALVKPAALRAVTILLEAGASPVDTIPPSPDLPESINGVPQPRYLRSALGLALMAGKVGFHTCDLNQACGCWASSPVFSSVICVFLHNLKAYCD